MTEKVGHDQRNTQLVWNDSLGRFEAATQSSGVTDHGLLSGLNDDDHTQYHTDARGDARYYTQAQVTSQLATKANSTHTHTESDITDLDKYTQSEVDTLVNGREAAFSKNTGFNKAFGSTAGTVVEGNDSRLSDSRTPLAHTHTKADITDFSDGDYATSAQGALADSALQSIPATYVQTSDSRLSDARTPTAHTHTKSEISDFSDSDYATAAQGAKADSALQNLSGSVLNDLSNVSGTASNGQVLSWNGAGWAPATITGKDIIRTSGRLVFNNGVWATAADPNFGENNNYMGNTAGSGAAPVYNNEHMGMPIRAGQVITRMLISGRGYDDYGDVAIHLSLGAPTGGASWNGGINAGADLSNTVIYSGLFENSNGLTSPTSDQRMVDIPLNYTVPELGFLYFAAKANGSISGTKYFTINLVIEMTTAS